MAVRSAYQLQAARHRRALLKTRLIAKAKADDDPSLLEEWSHESFVRPDTD